ncbi:MAG: 2-hydroxyacyl-CoA dehydratase family protein [Thermoguttaceae bacterium]
MGTIAYCQPLVPPEWIAAHGVRPHWLRLDVPAGGERTGVSRFPTDRGACPAAAAIIDAVERGLSAAAIVLTTTCDQARFAAAALSQRATLPVFLMHVPRTWETEAARSYYRDELRRFGRFLARISHVEPDEESLCRTMLRYDAARQELRCRRGAFSATAFADAVASLRGDCPEAACAAGDASDERDATSQCVNLALLGGPLLFSDRPLLQLIEKAGGRIVLDGSEGGERTLPAAIDAQRLRDDPLGELVRVYFDSIPDIFRRPNDALYEWLRRELPVRKVRGLIVRRHVWCDLWHAELPRLRQETSLPLLHLDMADGDRGLAVAVGRLEAFMEMLR